MARIHPTAVVDPSARLGEDVEIGPHCVVEADVEIGPRTRLRSHVVIRRWTSMGADNVVEPTCVLGGEPQDLKFDPASETYLKIGDGNVFREGVTISRATTPGGATSVGSNTYWMAYSHAGHDVTVHDGAVLVNGSAIGGHCTIGERAFLSANVIVHQFAWVGKLVIAEGNGSIRSHVPPYTMVVGRNHMFGLNVVGLRRAKDLSDEDRRQIKEAYKLMYRSKLKPPEALREMDARGDWGEAAAAFREFVRKALAADKPYNRGLIATRVRAGEE
ncbi:MAG TPA: acyl-ACP--UDP-N-acetylglucosamine O-acyltransferase [Phycisphaerae bacterium]|nr:acyl-ACP--UDP-N-acetylglucosamine O-acyltransferase [Phycisphaerae bacterium]